MRCGSYWCNCADGIMQPINRHSCLHYFMSVYITMAYCGTDIPVLLCLGARYLDDSYCGMTMLTTCVEARRDHAARRHPRFQEPFTRTQSFVIYYEPVKKAL